MEILHLCSNKENQNHFPESLSGLKINTVDTSEYSYILTPDPPRALAEAVLHLLENGNQLTFGVKDTPATN